jgi:hypothetical protein
VRLPQGSESRKARYSIAFFNQARSDTVIQGPAKKYSPIVRYCSINLDTVLCIVLIDKTGGQFIAEAMAKNRMQSAEIAKHAALLDAQRVASEVHFVPEHMRSIPISV